jgi:hypothetical protein
LKPRFKEKMNPVARAKYDKWEKDILRRADSDKETPEKSRRLFFWSGKFWGRRFLWTMDSTGKCSRLSALCVR